MGLISYIKSLYYNDKYKKAEICFGEGKSKEAEEILISILDKHPFAAGRLVAYYSSLAHDANVSDSITLLKSAIALKKKSDSVCDMKSYDGEISKFVNVLVDRAESEFNKSFFHECYSLLSKLHEVGFKTKKSIELYHGSLVCHILNELKSTQTYEKKFSALINRLKAEWPSINSITNIVGFIIALSKDFESARRFYASNKVLEIVVDNDHNFKILDNVEKIICGKDVEASPKQVKEIVLKYGKEIVLKPGISIGSSINLFDKCWSVSKEPSFIISILNTVETYRNEYISHILTNHSSYLSNKTLCNKFINWIYDTIAPPEKSIQLLEKLHNLSYDTEHYYVSKVHESVSSMSLENKLNLINHALSVFPMSVVLIDDKLDCARAYLNVKDEEAIIIADSLLWRMPKCDKAKIIKVCAICNIANAEQNIHKKISLLQQAEEIVKSGNTPEYDSVRDNLWQSLLSVSKCYYSSGSHDKAYEILQSISSQGCRNALVLIASYRLSEIKAVDTVEQKLNLSSLSIEEILYHRMSFINENPAYQEIWDIYIEALLANLKQYENKAALEHLNELVHKIDKVGFNVSVSQKKKKNVIKEIIKRKYLIARDYELVNDIDNASKTYHEINILEDSPIISNIIGVPYIIAFAGGVNDWDKSATYFEQTQTAGVFYVDIEFTTTNRDGNKFKFVINDNIWCGAGAEEGNVAINAGDNISVTKLGRYRIYLDLSDWYNPTYCLSSKDYGKAVKSIKPTLSALRFVICRLKNKDDSDILRHRRQIVSLLRNSADAYRDEKNDIAYRFALSLLKCGEDKKALQVLSEFLPNEGFLKKVCLQNSIIKAQASLDDFNKKLKAVSNRTLSSYDAISFINHMLDYIADISPVLTLTKTTLIKYRNTLKRYAIYKLFDEGRYDVAFEKMLKEHKDYLTDSTALRNIAVMCLNVAESNQIRHENYKEVIAVWLTAIYQEKLFIASLNHTSWDDKFRFSLYNAYGHFNSDSYNDLPDNIITAYSNDSNIVHIRDVQMALLDRFESAISAHQDYHTFFTNQKDAMDAFIALNLDKKCHIVAPFLAKNDTNIFQSIVDAFEYDRAQEKYNWEDILSIGAIYKVGIQIYNDYSLAKDYFDECDSVINSKSLSESDAKTTFASSKILLIKKFGKLFSALVANVKGKVSKLTTQNMSDFRRKFNFYIILCVSIKDNVLSYMFSTYVMSFVVGQVNEKNMNPVEASDYILPIYLLDTTNKRTKDNLSILFEILINETSIQADKAILSILNKVKNVDNDFYVQLYNEREHAEVEKKLSNIVKKVNENSMKKHTALNQIYDIYSIRSYDARVCQNLAQLCDICIMEYIIGNKYGRSEVERILDILKQNASIEFQRHANIFKKSYIAIWNQLDSNTKLLLNGNNQSFSGISLNENGLALKKGLDYYKSLGKI